MAVFYTVKLVITYIYKLLIYIYLLRFRDYPKSLTGISIRFGY